MPTGCLIILFAASNTHEPSKSQNQHIIARLRTHPGSVIFFGVRIRLGTILGRFSIIYFRGLGLRVRVWVTVWARVIVRVSARCYDQGKFRVRGHSSVT